MKFVILEMATNNVYTKVLIDYSVYQKLKQYEQQILELNKEKKKQLEIKEKPEVW